VNAKKEELTFGLLKFWSDNKSNLTREQIGSASAAIGLLIIFLSKMFTILLINTPAKYIKPLRSRLKIELIIRKKPNKNGDINAPNWKILVMVTSIPGI
jgi:hypothetical protein